MESWSKNERNNNNSNSNNNSNNNSSNKNQNPRGGGTKMKLMEADRERRKWMFAPLQKVSAARQSADNIPTEMIGISRPSIWGFAVGSVS